MCVEQGRCLAEGVTVNARGLSWTEFRLSGQSRETSPHSLQLPLRPGRRAALGGRAGVAGPTSRARVAAGSAPRACLLRAAGGPGAGPSQASPPGRPAARGGARGLSPGAGEFWESPAQGGGPAAARAAVRAARRARRARSEVAAPGGGAPARGRTGGGGGRPPSGSGGGAPRLCLPGCASRALARLCALLASAPPLTHSSGDTRRR